MEKLDVSMGINEIQKQYDKDIEEFQKNNTNNLWDECSCIEEMNSVVYSWLIDKYYNAYNIPKRVLKYFLEELYPQDLYIDSWETIEKEFDETLIIFTKALNIYKEEIDANR